MLLPFNARAQKAALSFNVGDFLCLGTMNLEFDYAVSQRWSLDVGARVNPWTFFRGDELRQTQLKHQTYSIGMRFWSWYVYSGFWMGAKLQFQEYNRGGFNGNLKTEEGNAYGIGFELGYTFIISHRWNLNLGAGGWGGYADYTQYSCSCCGRKTEEGGKIFFWPNELIVAFVCVF